LLNMKKIILTLFIIFAGINSVHAETTPLKMDESTKQVCNKVIASIYQDILSVKDKYKELSQFDEKVLYENKQGIFALLYQYNESDRQARRHPFEFGVTIVGLNDKIFEEYGQYAFYLSFPILGLKFAGFQKSSARYNFDLGEIINKNGSLLAEHQQKYMPLQLTLKAEKDTYLLYEPIRFVVELKNTSPRHMRVKTLTDKTLYCVYDNKMWGAVQTQQSQAQEMILKSGETTNMVFEGQDFMKPKEFEIFCSYNMTIQGVQPTGHLAVTVLNQ